MTYKGFVIVPTGKDGDFAYSARKYTDYGSATFTGPLEEYLVSKIDERW